MHANYLTKAGLLAAVLTADASNTFATRPLSLNDPDPYFRGFAHGNRRRNRLKRLARNARQRNRRK